jgi:uncharacterized protein YhbP (UPF0306 family)
MRPVARDAAKLALDYLQSHQVMTLATHGQGGVWAAAVFYVCDNAFVLTFLSAGHTRHARHIAASGRAAAAVQEDYRDWQEIRGIQLEGAVSLLAGAAREAALSRYVERYPFVGTTEGPGWEALAAVAWYRLVPDRLYFIDNSLGLGHRDRII